MSKIKVTIYEPPMCCPTGACGPNVDDKLVKFNEALKQLKKEGIEVERNSMNNNPIAFQQNKAILDLVNTQGTKDLPATAINGTFIKLGEYPTLEELKAEIAKVKEAK
ncbi:arsenical resistance operon trans-acting repressor ArsD [Orenia metallireducens]|uniref:Arsenical resistance operon trans-acting repressor ArsD n=1 Tax=Orenia metallireducens TaxID=1413210 RepID=A0A285HJX6_9FIRM|nr:arsenite efflux transporter metallochaperone ArsD [Orenia metallireducens]PRX27167.1 arsenical resistance operon trans-acting repressor ArsD [Orenia metallireducens]SNY35076.1 Arsenical resistance operon trans-acting repressor ArsD [Orenia metallireducens]